MTCLFKIFIFSGDISKIGTIEWVSRSYRNSSGGVLGPHS